MDEWESKSIIYIYNGVFFSFKNEGNSDIYYSVDES